MDATLLLNKICIQSSETVIFNLQALFCIVGYVNIKIKINTFYSRLRRLIDVLYYSSLRTAPCRTYVFVINRTFIKTDNLQPKLFRYNGGSTVLYRLC